MTPRTRPAAGFAPDGDALLAVSDLRVGFPSEHGEVSAVRGMSYSIAAGEVLAIVGESGSGKSASSLAVMGLLPPTARVEGSVRFRGEELLGRGEEALSTIPGRDIAMIFQDPLSAFTPVYTVGDQVAEAIRVHQGMSKARARDRAAELLDLVGIPNARERLKSFPHEFSGGMRQRAMIAMAIANDPDLLIADEPTTALDVTVQAQVLEVLRTARQATGAAILLVTHDLGIVAGIADRVLVMYAGRAVEQAKVDDLYDDPKMPYTIGLLGSIPRLDDRGSRTLTPIDGHPPSLVALPRGCPFEPRCPVAIQACREVEPALAPVGLPGQRAACHRAGEIDRGRIGHRPVFPVPGVTTAPVADVPRSDRPPLLQVSDLARHYPLLRGAVFRRQAGTVHAVDGVDLDIRAGEALGLVGESGCGKTSTIMEILELRAPTRGTVVVLGHDTREMNAARRKRIRRDVQVVFQDPLASLDPRLPVGDVVAEPLKVHGVPAGRRRARVGDLLRLVGLNAEHANRFPQEFSGGQRQRVAIARALALDPRLVVLDEPVSALDVSIQAGVLNLLQDLKARLSLSYLFVAHDLSVVRHIADRVGVMYLGRIVEIGDVKEVFDRAQHPYTQALLSAVPVPDPPRERARRRIVLTGDLPSPVDPPAGCRFRFRCFVFAALDEQRRARCVGEDPALVVRDRDEEVDHLAACHYARERAVV